MHVPLRCIGPVYRAFETHAEAPHNFNEALSVSGGGGFIVRHEAKRANGCWCLGGIGKRNVSMLMH